MGSCGVREGRESEHIKLKKAFDDYTHLTAWTNATASRLAATKSAAEERRIFTGEVDASGAGRS